jgi:tetratricopeptide (TPR) repeat protein
MNLRKNSFRAAGIFWLVGLTAALAEPRDDFKAANHLYDVGKFADAAAVYEKIEPKTAHMYYNLGNALFRQDKLGLAVLSYERARTLSPRDPDILANLKFAEQRLGVVEANVPLRGVQRFLRSVIESRTPNEWSVYELVGLWLTALGITAWIYFPRMRTGLLLITVFGFVGFATSALALSYQIINDHNAPQGIIVVSGADARFAPLPDSTIHFRLVEGAQIVIREDRGQWLLVERPDGQQGWVRAKAVGRITPL